MSVTPWTSKTCGENGKLNTTYCIPERVAFCGKKVKRVFFFLRCFLFFNYLCTIFKGWSMIDTLFYKIFYFGILFLDRKLPKLCQIHTASNEYFIFN